MASQDSIRTMGREVGIRPDLPFEDWKDTCTTLHLWTQIAGKIRLACAPMVNHWWQSTLYVTSSGLTTSAMPYGRRAFQIDFDFIDHRLKIAVSDGRQESFTLAPCTVAEFYAQIMGRLRSLGLEVRIWTMPCELPDAIPFEDDRVHSAYDAEKAQWFWRTLLFADQRLREFRAGFIGKVSPVHFFWGSFDLAVTRFSGRRAPPHPPAPYMADWVVREAYSHEVSSCGFWPGNGGFGRAAFYSYAYPAPPGFSEGRIAPDGAFFSDQMQEFILPYDRVAQSAAPDRTVLEFLQSSYDIAADLGKWNRSELERPIVTPS
jgi:hypothetical protein